jgi:phospholipase C
VPSNRARHLTEEDPTDMASTPQRPERRTTVSRRTVLKAGAAAGVAGAVGRVGLDPARGRLIERAAAASPAGGSLAEIKHLVILMQENRSFDHYFGTMAGVRGYDDPSALPGVFDQVLNGTSITGATASYRLADGSTTLAPFELVSHPPSVAGQTLDDITHDWGPQHGMWHDGAMDRFAVEHLANDPTAKYRFVSAAGVPIPVPASTPVGLTTMGYYRRSDCMAFYRALADAFTICDGYHCSVIGPTDPNRLMWMSGSLGAHSGDQGGPVLETYVQNRPEMFGSLVWPTMPELLTAHGVSWKVYQDPTSNLLFNVLPYFRSFAKPSTPTEVANAARGLTPLYPTQFELDVAAGTLPTVSWLIPPVPCCEHPAVPPEYGEWLVAQILATLVANPEVWASTVFVVIWDENGGFFDHVPPPTPGPTVQDLAALPPGTGPGGQLDGEYVTTAHPTNAAGGPPSDWAGVLGPVGLGFRVPALVLSPFSAGGWVCSDTFDHVSTLKLIERLFLPPGTIMGADGLHVSPWRYRTVGDLTTALPTLTTPVEPVPALPATSLLFPEVATQALLESVTGTADLAPAYPPPAANSDAYRTQDPERPGFTRRRTPH